MDPTGIFAGQSLTNVCRREWNLNNLSMLWEKQSYNLPSSTSSIPDKEQDSQLFDLIASGARWTEPTSGSTTTKCEAKSGSQMSHTDGKRAQNNSQAFEGKTSMENWLKKDHRHEQFWNKTAEK
jgi:hypothetical protein